MKIDDDERRYLWWPADSTANLDGSTVVLEIDNITTTYPMSWTTTTAAGGSGFLRTARTVSTFIGSTLTVGGNDVQLTVGRHVGQPRVTLADGQTIVGPETPIDVA